MTINVATSSGDVKRPLGIPPMPATIRSRAVSASTPIAFPTVDATPSGPSQKSVATGPGEIVEVRRRSRTGDNLRPLVGERSRRGQADAASGSRYNSDLVLECEVHALSGRGRPNHPGRARSCDIFPARLPKHVAGAPGED